jgi:hypothetical protein
MHVCPNCGTGFHDDEDFCLDCGLKLSREEHDCVPLDRQMRFRAVYKAPDEWTAVTIKELLQAAGHSVQVICVHEPWHDHISRMVEGYWGKVLVLESEADSARKLIEDYLRGLDRAVH